MNALNTTFNSCRTERTEEMKKKMRKKNMRTTKWPHKICSEWVLYRSCAFYLHDRYASYVSSYVRMCVRLPFLFEFPFNRIDTRHNKQKYCAYYLLLSFMYKCAVPVNACECSKSHTKPTTDEHTHARPTKMRRMRGIFARWDARNHKMITEIEHTHTEWIECIVICIHIKIIFAST